MAIANWIQQIRHAVYGRDVREAIASGIEECYADTSTGKTTADAASDAVTEFVDEIRAEIDAGNFHGAKGDQGETGTGIESIVQNADDTLTIQMTDGTSYTTDPVRGPQGIQGEQGAPAPVEDVQDAVDAYLDEHITNPSSPPLDRTLTSSVAAAPADVVGDLIKISDEEFEELKSAIDSINDSIFEQYDLSTKQTDKLNISPTTDYWNKNNNISAYYFEIPEYAKALYLQSNLLNGSTFALLSASDTHTHNDLPVYATGSGRTVIEAGEKKEIVIPDDCKYLWVLNAYSNKSMLPEFIGFNKDIPKVDTTLSVSGNAADAKATGDRINTILNKIYVAETVDTESATIIRGLINTSNLWSTSSGFYSYAFSIDKNYSRILVTAQTETKAIIGLLKNSNLINQNTPDYATGFSDKIVVNENNTLEIDIPDDCTYIVITKEADSVDRTPEEITFYKWNIGTDTTYNPLGLHEFPKSESALNIVKRCRQMTDIKWTPAVDLPRYMRVQCSGEIPETAAVQNYLGTFKAGTEYTGIPYGRVSDTMDEYGYDYATAGHYIDFETFVSSVFNPKSKLCNENVGSVPQHKSVIYASVCSGLTCYALNVQEVPTSRIANISGLETIGKINNNGVLLSDANFNIGDILNKYDYHTAIITDIIRDNEGNIQFVELADASTAGLADRNFSDGQIGGVCRRKGWTRDQLFDANSWGDYTLYRYTKNVPYTPSPYVNIGNEFNMQRIEHFPVMPYEGNKFVYKTGYIQNDAVKLVIALSGYSYLKVFKDGTEITGSPFAITNGTDDIDVTEVSVGEYSAYLCNITNGDVVNLSYPCHWTIS